MCTHILVKTLFIHWPHNGKHVRVDMHWGLVKISFNLFTCCLSLYAIRTCNLLQVVSYVVAVDLVENFCGDSWIRFLYNSVRYSRGTVLSSLVTESKPANDHSKTQPHNPSNEDPQDQLPPSLCGGFHTYFWTITAVVRNRKLSCLPYRHDREPIKS